MGQLKWGGKTFYPQSPKPIKSDINELMKPLSEKVDKGNVWGSIIMNVPEESAVPVSPTPTPSVTPTMTVTPSSSLTPTPSVTATLTPTPTITPTITPTLTKTPTPTPTPSPQPISLSYITSTGSTTDATSYTFNNVSIGGPGLIVLGIGHYISGVDPERNITGITIGGVAATTVVPTAIRPWNTRIAYARISSGTTADIVVSFGSGNGIPENINIGVWRIQNNISDTPYQNQYYADGFATMALNFTSLSANTVGVINVTFDAGRNISWSGATNRYTTTREVAEYSGADFTSVGGGNLTVTNTYTGTGSQFKVAAGAVWR